MDIGAQLRTAREAKGLSIGALAERTRVPARALAAIELNNQSSLPPHPFGRGFVRTYAEEVDLDPDRIVREYFAQFPAQPASGHATVSRDAPGPSWQPSSTWVGMGTAVAILMVVVTAAVVLGRRGETAADPGTVGTTGAVPATPAATGHDVAACCAARDRTRCRRHVASGSCFCSAAPAGAITVVLSMSRPCWVAATVDGQRTIYRVLPPGRSPDARGGARHRDPFRRCGRRGLDDQRPGRRRAGCERRGARREHHAGERRERALRKCEV